MDLEKVAERKKKRNKYEKFIEKIRKAGNNKKLVSIDYTDKKGSRTNNRRTEPYKLEGDNYWGYCLTRDDIRRFKIPQLENVRIVNKKFQPRWDIEVDNYPVKISNSKEACDDFYKQANTSNMAVRKMRRKRMKDDPFRATKAVAANNLFDNALDTVVDAGTMLAGFVLGSKLSKEKGLKNKLKSLSFKEVKKSLSTPEARTALKNFKNQQKFAIPIGTAITGAYVGRQYLSDRNRANKISKSASVNSEALAALRKRLPQSMFKVLDEKRFPTNSKHDIFMSWNKVNLADDLTEGEKVAIRKKIIEAAKEFNVNTKGWRAV